MNNCILGDKVNQIVERVIFRSEAPELFEVLFPDGSFRDLLDEEEDPEFYCMYIEGDTPEAITGFTIYEGFDNDYVDLLHFKEVLFAHKPTSFWDLCVLLDIYVRRLIQRRRTLDSIIFEFKITSLPIVDDILHLSKGFLLWHFQIENLFGLFETVLDARIRFRKNMNKKASTWVDEARKMLFTNNISLYDVVVDRSVPLSDNEHTSNPNFKGAYLLYNHITAVQER